jgi:glycosyltransferase involved in cell wall biosynthesis
MLTPSAGQRSAETPMPFDIMMPFYGRIDHFRIAVQSVLDQTDEDWRLVVIDDHYPDPTAGEWLNGLGDERIEYVRHAANVGINANFQEAVDRSVADWFTIFGCDDALHPGYVRHMRSLATAFPDAAMLHPGVRIIDEDGEVVRTIVDSAKAFYRPRAREPIRLSGEQLATSVTRGNWMNFPAVAWHGPRTRAMGFRDGYEVVQDLALVLDLCQAGGSLIVDDTVEFDYRRHAGSVSSWKAVDGSRFLEERAFFVQLARQFDDRGWHQAARAARFHLSSRVNALTRIPSALVARDGSGVRTLAGHTFGRSR